MVIPDELAAGCGQRTRAGAHLTLQGQCEVVGVAEVEVAGQVNVLKHFQVSARKQKISQSGKGS